jgi:hypothetical protein
LEGVCVPVCEAGWGDCNGDPGDGCEESIDSDPACTQATELAGICGDEYGPLPTCSTSCTSGPTATGHGERWYHLDVDECSYCCADTRVRARLYVPAGVDYDLHLWEACGTLVDSSAGDAEVEEVTGVGREGMNDCLIFDSGRSWYLEVRYSEGSSCEDWRLEVRGGCPGGW